MNHLSGQKLEAMNMGHSNGAALTGHDSLRSDFVCTIFQKTAKGGFKRERQKHAG